MTEFIDTVMAEMLRGNFSFLICLVGIAQLIVMIVNLKRRK